MHKKRNQRRNASTQVRINRRQFLEAQNDDRALFAPTRVGLIWSNDAANKWRTLGYRRRFQYVELPLMAAQRPLAGRPEPEISLTDVSLRGPTYRNISHVHHSWDVGTPRRAKLLVFWARERRPYGF